MKNERHWIRAFILPENDFAAWQPEQSGPLLLSHDRKQHWRQQPQQALQHKEREAGYPDPRAAAR